MKKLLLASVVLTSVSCMAAEYPQNPDRFPSIGLTLSGDGETGTLKAGGFSQDVTTKSSAIVLDTRLPLSNSFTLNLGIGATGGELKADQTNVLSEQKNNTSGGVFTIGARYYFNH